MEENNTAVDMQDNQSLDGQNSQEKSAQEKRGGFTSKIGFVLAAAGSAVGLGNIWRFPYLAAKYGGGIFLLTYIILAVTFGFVLMIAEIALGRKTGMSAINALKTQQEVGVFGRAVRDDSYNNFALLFRHWRLGRQVFLYVCLRRRYVCRRG